MNKVLIQPLSKIYLTNFLTTVPVPIPIIITPNKISILAIASDKFIGILSFAPTPLNKFTLNKNPSFRQLKISLYSYILYFITVTIVSSILIPNIEY